NGVEGLELVDRAFIDRREPAVSAVAALWSPETGVVNAEELVKTLLRTAAGAGAVFLPGTRLIGPDRDPEGLIPRTARETIRAGARAPDGRGGCCATGRASSSVSAAPASARRMFHRAKRWRIS